MPPLSSLPPQQRAVLALILEKGKTYDEIAALLGVEVEAVRQRAHEALAGLAPEGGAKPAIRYRAAIGNYLLGQDPDDALETFAYLEKSVAGRDWAHALATELAPLADGALPPIPGDPDEPDDPDEPAEPDDAEAMPESASAAPGPPPPRPPESGPENDESAPLPDDIEAVSRRGGALLILLVLVLVAGAVAAFVLLRGGSSHPKTAAPAKTATTPAKLAGQIKLTPAPGVKSRAFAALIVRGTQKIVAIAASGLRPTSPHLAYGVFLFNTRADAQLIGFIPPVKADGKISAAAPIPAGAARFHELVITRETGMTATRPGTIIFTGAIPAG